ncbi:HPP family protein [Chloroflexota bacterium]
MWLDLLNDFKWRCRRIGSEFKELWKNYLYQSFLAAIVLAAVMFVLTMQDAVVIASIGATAFIVFLMPNNVTANPRRVVGGHIMGLISGSLAALILHHTVISYIVVYAIAVGLSAFLMVALDFEHPPASGTALGIAITGLHPSVFFTVIASSVMLSIAHRIFRKYLRDLT